MHGNTVPFLIVYWTWNRGGIGAASANPSFACAVRSRSARLPARQVWPHPVAGSALPRLAACGSGRSLLRGLLDCAGIFPKAHGVRGVGAGTGAATGLAGCRCCRRSLLVARGRGRPRESDCSGEGSAHAPVRSCPAEDAGS